MPKPKDKAVAGEKTPQGAVSASAMAPRTALEFARAVRQMYAAAEYEPNLFYCLIGPHDPDDWQDGPDPYTEVIELLEVVMNTNPVFWEGAKEDGLKFLDLVIGILEARI